MNPLPIFKFIICYGRKNRYFRNINKERNNKEKKTHNIMSKRKQNLYIIYQKNDSLTSINEKLVTTYMNYIIIEEEAQFEVVEILDLREKSNMYEAIETKSGLMTTDDWGYKIGRLFFFLEKSQGARNGPAELMLWTALSLFIWFTGYMSSLCAHMADKNPGTHFIIGIDSDFLFFSSWFRDLKNRISVAFQSKTITFTFLGGNRTNIILKENIRTNASQTQGYSKLMQSYLGLRSLWKSNEPISNLGDDVEVLFDQMKNGEIQNTKNQPLQGYFMLSEMESELFKAKDHDFLQTIRGSSTKNIKLPFTAPFNPPKLDGSEILFCECEGTRTTLS